MNQMARHPADTTLAAYAAGTLDHGLSLVIATHLSVCPACRETCEAADMLGGVMIDEVAPAEISNDLLRRTISELSDAPLQAETDAEDVAPAKTWHGLPAPLSDLIPADEHQVTWWTVAPGLRLAALPGLGMGDGIRLLRIKPGRTVPHHGHGGHELTLIIQGSYIDTDGTFLPGDIADMDQETEHQPEATGDQDCICVIATDARLEFSGLAPRLMQPIIGI